MFELQESRVSCPYCGETLDVLIDTSIAQQNYIEDCQVCCRPIIFGITIDDKGIPTIITTSEDE